MESKIWWREDAPPSDVPATHGAAPCVIAIPARDEAALIGPCLRALALQEDAPQFVVALVLNNCRDDTASVVASMVGELPFPLHVFNIELPPELSDAAWARRLAVNAAMSLASKDGVVLTTDADSRADSKWVRATLDCFDAGADIVCGFVAPDFNDAPSLPFETLRKGALEFEYSQLTAELASLADPDAFDPWPNHLIETGANLSVRAHVLADIGGIPHVCPGEDQRFVAMARRRGYRIRHTFLPSVTTSSRIRGRAAGGWSDDLLARAEDDRATCHPKLEAARQTLRRALWRARLRNCFGTAAFTAFVRRLAPDSAAQALILAASAFSEAWALLEENSAALTHAPLLVARLETDIERLRAYVTRLQGAPTAKAGASLLGA